MKYLSITYDLLESKGACPEGLELFKGHIGLERHIPLTKKTVEKFSSIFDIYWASENLLDSEDYLEYHKVHGLALAKFQKVRETAWSEYDKVHDIGWTEYKKVRDLAYAEYEKVRATEFVRLYKLGME